MNEVYKVIAAKATRIAADEFEAKIGKGANLHSSDIGAIRDRIFAELILKETVNVVCNVRMNAIADFEIGDRKELNRFLLDTSSVAMIHAVDKHFGIEE